MVAELTKAYVGGDWIEGAGGSAEYRATYDDSILGTFTACGANVEQALDIANSTSFGLNAAAFTDNLRDAWRFVDGLQRGTVLINETTNYWDQLAPFGRAKSSGFGWALGAFTETKTVVFDIS